MGGDGGAAEAIVRSRVGESLQEFRSESGQRAFAGRRVSRIAEPIRHPFLLAQLRAAQAASVIAHASGGDGGAAIGPEPMFPPAGRAINVDSRVPVLPVWSHWDSAYTDLKVRLEQVRANGDTYAICAYDAAIEAIDTQVMGIYRQFATLGSEKGVFEPVAAHGALLRLAERAESSPETACEASAIRNALQKIDAVARRKQFELGLRDRQFAAVTANVPTSHRCFPPDREGLNRWLGHAMRLADLTAHRAFDRNDLATAVPVKVRSEYFQRLMEPAIGESDVWTDSRALILKAIDESDLARAGEFTAAHRRLVRAMADGVLQTTARAIDTPDGPLVRPADWACESVPGAGPMQETGTSSRSVQKESPGFDWFRYYRRLRALRRQAERQSDSFMKIACCETIESIEAAVMKAYRTVEGQADIAPEQAYSELKLIQLKQRAHQTAIQQSKSLLASIDRLTREKRKAFTSWQINRSAVVATGNLRTPGSVKVAAATRQLIVHQLAQGQPLSRGQAGEIAWRANLADSLGWPHTSGYGVMRKLPGQLARLSGSAEPSTGGSFSVGSSDLKEFAGVLAALETAGCLE